MEVRIYAILTINLKNKYICLVGLVVQSCLFIAALWSPVDAPACDKFLFCHLP